MPNTFKPVLTPQDMTTAERNLIASLLILNAKDLEDSINIQVPIEAIEYKQIEINAQRNLANRIMTGVRTQGKQDCQEQTNSATSNKTTLNENLVFTANGLAILETARKVLLGKLMEFRGARITEFTRTNGLVFQEKDSTPNKVIRFGPETELYISLRAIAEHLKVGGQGKTISACNIPQPAIANVMCDKHSNTLSFKRVLDETDLSSIKYINVCQHCYDMYLVTANKPVTGSCDYCNSLLAYNILPVKDLGEGSSSPAMYMCEACRSKVLYPTLTK